MIYLVDIILGIQPIRLFIGNTDMVKDKWTNDARDLNGDEGSFTNMIMVYFILKDHGNIA